MNIRTSSWFTALVLPLSFLSCAPRVSPTEIAVAHDNRAAAGQLENKVLTLGLEARLGRWFPEGDSGPALPAQFFAEPGKPASVPGPLIRIPTGTRILATVHNRLDSTLVLHGLTTHPGPANDSVVIAPGATARLDFEAGEPGTYFYWASTTRKDLETREWLDSQLGGAFIVDSADNKPDDRVFVLSAWGHFLDTIIPPDTGEVMMINGRGWPYTERLDLMVGDTVQWRLVNPSYSSHPMHLHGVFFRLASRGDWRSDTLLAPDRRPLEVTELVAPGGTALIRWAPAQPGNWVFHCHFAFHVTGATMKHGSDAGHSMSGLVLGIHANRPDSTPVAAAPVPARPIRILVEQQDDGLPDGPAYGYQIDDGKRPLAPGKVTFPSPTLVLTRGEPVAITVVNHLRQPTSVHWHGMELESYPDGVPGWSGSGTRRMPPIAPGDSFTARFTPPRTGTFIYHTHFDEQEQMSGGLYAPLLVLEPGQHFDPDQERLILVGLGGRNGAVDTLPSLVNGSHTPAPLDLRAGRTYRLRLINIDADHRIGFTLRRGTSVVNWRALARDGADLPAPLQTIQPADIMTGAGQTADFSFTPQSAGTWQLDVAAPFAIRPWTVPLLLKAQ